MMEMIRTHSQDGRHPDNPVSSIAPAEQSASKLESARNHATGPRTGSPALQFRKAIKWHAKLRFAVCGPAGSGKTYTVLKLATGLGGPMALIDTERGSASKYADIFEFDVLELGSYDPARLIEIIDEVAEKGYRALCIDSLSHFWMGKDGELDKVDRAARRMQTPNSFAAWKEVTPLHNALIDKIVSAPLHILVSMRSKAEWIIDRDERTGKTAPRKVGLAPVMRDGIEYEFDVCGDMDQENTLVITKSRCPKLAGGVFPKPGKELADLLKEWLGGVPVEPVGLEPSNDVPAASEVPRKGAGSVNGIGGLQTVAVITEELAAIWKRMCSPRGVLEEFEDLKTAVEKLAGSAGVAEYYRILRQHGVERPRQFQTMQPARLCAKDVYVLLEQLRANARENQAAFSLGPEMEPAVTKLKA
jgi:hypothetical protein